MSGTRREFLRKVAQAGGYRATYLTMMHGPDGTDYPNKVVYREIVKPERLVYDHTDDRDPPSQQFQTTVTFAAQGRKTMVTLRALFANAEARAASVKFGAIEGGAQTLARLDQHVATMSERG